PLVGMAERLFRPPRLHAFVGFLLAGLGHLLGGHLGGDFFAFLAFAFGHLRFGGFLRAFLIAFAAFFGLRRGLGIGAFAVGLGIVGEFITQFEIVQNGARELREALLIAHRFFELGEVLARALFDPGAPQFDGFLRVFRRRKARQSFAYDQPDRIGEGHVRTLAHLGDAARRQLRIEIGGEIVRYAFHGVRADGFHARLFGRFEDCGSVRRLWAELLVDVVFVIGAAQRIGIALATH